MRLEGWQPAVLLPPFETAQGEVILFKRNMI